MRNSHLQLTLHDPRFSVTPLPVQAAHICMSTWCCRKVASHRVESRTPPGSVVLCDEHIIDWTLYQGMGITGKPSA